MAKIIAINKEYTGVSASVAFVNGVGETSDPYLIGWFREHGYEVVEDSEPEKEAFESEVEHEKPKTKPRKKDDESVE